MHWLSMQEKNKKDEETLEKAKLVKLRVLIVITNSIHLLIKYS